MQRVPIRVRLTLAFAFAGAIVLLCMGLLVYYRVRAEIDRGATTALETRASDLVTLVRQAGPPVTGSRVHVLRASGESSAQVLDPGGRARFDAVSLRRAPAECERSSSR